MKRDPYRDVLAGLPAPVRQASLEGRAPQRSDGVELTSEGVVALLDDLKERARSAYREKRWAIGRELCSEHDKLALAYPHILRMSKIARAELRDGRG